MNADPAWLAAQFPSLSSVQGLSIGGQKSVFSAVHRGEGDVVLKLIHPGQDVERVRREIEAVNRVNSSRVPRILDVGTVGSNVGPIVWIREQRIAGHPLREELTAKAPLPRERVLGVGLHVLEALAAAEAVRIVHRDVKPDNIMVDPTGSAWLLDFGLSRHLDLASVTATAMHWGVGTPGYAPPEQFRNQKRNIDARADLFGLGVTLYECATGINPFREGARDDLEIVRRVESQPLPRLSQQWDDNRQFGDFVSTLVQPHRDHRPGSAGEALAWMQEIVRHHAVL